MTYRLVIICNDGQTITGQNSGVYDLCECLLDTLEDPFYVPSRFKKIFVSDGTSLYEVLRSEIVGLSVQQVADFVTALVVDQSLACS